jgi:Histidine kinase-, DNA gyrase B-, and HSP90-like ATPase
VNRSTVRCRSVVQGLARARCWNRDAGLVRLAYDARGGGGQFVTTRSTVGTGIGLFVAKQFIEDHGGQTELESRQNREGHGTTVRVFLPISTTYDSSGEGVRAMGNEMQKIVPPLPETLLLGN